MPSHPIIESELKKVRLYKAKGSILDGNSPEKLSALFETCGSKFILQKLLDDLKEFEPRLIFFEHSYFATATDDNKNAVFVCIWQNGDLKLENVNKFQHFFTKLDKEFEDLYPILWHPEFFIFPPSPDFYYSDTSTYSDNLNSFISAEYKDEPKVFKVVNGEISGDIYNGSFLFPLHFKRKVDGIVKDVESGKKRNTIQSNLDALKVSYDLVFDKANSHEEYSYKIAIPILGSPIQDDREYFGQGSVWIYIITKGQIPEDKLRTIAKECSIYFKDISINYVFQKGIELAATSLLQATRAAIAQVMARNMSHNIGSHVLNKVYKILLAATGGTTKYKLAANLFEFIQQRMEFIANGINASFQSNHLLFEEILPAYFSDAKRRDLKFLFDNITGSEIIDSSKIRFQQVKNNFSTENISVSIPNGTLGFHALYTLLENIIRNSVKHNQEYPLKEDKTPEIVYSLEIKPDDNYLDYFKVTITDNFGEKEREKKNGTNPDTLNKTLRAPILKEGTGELRPNGWGLLEMKICASYLIGLPIEAIDKACDKDGSLISVKGIETNFPPALSVSKDDNENIVHTFYLQKPKVAAVVGNNFKGSFFEGIEPVKNKPEFENVGSKHDFAVYDNINSHEADTNQRSVFFDAETEQTEGETALWEKYASEKNWNTEDIEIVSVRDYSDFNVPLSDNKRYIVFDNHSYWAKHSEQKGLEKIETKPDKFIFYEAVNAASATMQGVCLKLPSNRATIESILKAKIFEAAFTDVIVLDERIQKNFDERKGSASKPGTDPHYVDPKFSNLFIPPREGALDLDQAKTDDVIGWAKTIPTFKKDFKLNYLVIHRSLIGEGRIKIEKLENELKQFLGKDFFTVYVSGGGAPPSLENGYYMPFDLLNFCLSSPPSKFALVSILKSIRKINKQ